MLYFMSGLWVIPAVKNLFSSDKKSTFQGSRVYKGLKNKFAARRARKEKERERKEKDHGLELSTHAGGTG